MSWYIRRAEPDHGAELTPFCFVTLFLSASGGGGVLAADGPDVDLTGSVFANNRAEYFGGVAVFSSVAALPSQSVQAIISTCLAGISGALPCPAANNTAGRWGPWLALQITSLLVFLPPITRPGIPFTTLSTLLDGYGQPVMGLPGATLSVQLDAPSSLNPIMSISGTLRTTYDSINTTLVIAVKGGEGSFPGMVFAVQTASSSSGGAVLWQPVQGLNSIQIASCDNLEDFSPTSNVCTCVANAVRSNTADLSSQCLCVAGYYDGGVGACLPCAPGNYSTTGGQCTPCASGAYSAAAAPSCTVCPQFSITFDNVVCQCIQGYSPDTSGAAMVCKCVRPRVGRWSLLSR